MFFVLTCGKLKTMSPTSGKGISRMLTRSIRRLPKVHGRQGRKIKGRFPRPDQRADDAIGKENVTELGNSVRSKGKRPLMRRPLLARCLQTKKCGE
jgi:hypothetical protein